MSYEYGDKVQNFEDYLNGKLPEFKEIFGNCIIDFVFLLTQSFPIQIKIGLFPLGIKISNDRISKNSSRFSSIYYEGYYEGSHVTDNSLWLKLERAVTKGNYCGKILSKNLDYLIKTSSQTMRVKFTVSPLENENQEWYSSLGGCTKIERTIIW